MCGGGGGGRGNIIKLMMTYTSFVKSLISHTIYPHFDDTSYKDNNDKARCQILPANSPIQSWFTVDHILDVSFESVWGEKEVVIKIDHYNVCSRKHKEREERKGIVIHRIHKDGGHLIVPLNLPEYSVFL